jgi:DNA-binding transcriptional regulator YbjK
MNSRFQGMMTHMDQRMDAMQSRFDDNWDALNTEYSEFRSHIQDHVTDPIMNRLNNMQQSFQDNMGALSSQFDNLSTNDNMQEINQRQQQLQQDFGQFSSLSLTPLALTTIACILHQVVSEAPPLWQLMPKGERSEVREEEKLSYSGGACLYGH